MFWRTENRLLHLFTNFLGKSMAKWVPIQDNLMCVSSHDMLDFNKERLWPTFSYNYPNSHKLELSRHRNKLIRLLSDDISCGTITILTFVRITQHLTLVWTFQHTWAENVKCSSAWTIPKVKFHVNTPHVWGGRRLQCWLGIHGLQSPACTIHTLTHVRCRVSPG